MAWVWETGSPYPFFDKAHFDFRDFQQGQGRMVLDLMPEVGPIESADGTHGMWTTMATSISMIASIGSTTSSRPTSVTRTSMASSTATTWSMVFQAGEYEDGFLENSSWFTGDWNGDYEFDSHDMVLAFQEGAYEQGPRARRGCP